jgi:hypothetical protein
MGNFDDVEREIGEQRGVLDGAAFQNQEKVSDALSSDGQGWQFTCNCQHCNRQSQVTVPWAELVVASVGVLPVDVDSQRPWLTQGGFLYPPVLCQACKQMLSIPITPDKAMRCLRTGVSMKKVDPTWVQQSQAQTMQRVQHLRR